MNRCCRALTRFWVLHNSAARRRKATSTSARATSWRRARRNFSLAVSTSRAVPSNPQGGGSQGNRILRKEHFEQIIIVPARFEPLGLHARATALLLSQQAQCEVAQHRKGLRRMTPPPPLIFLKDHLEHPVQAVLAPPVASDCLPKLRGRVQQYKLRPPAFRQPQGPRKGVLGILRKIARHQNRFDLHTPSSGVCPLAQARAVPTD